MTFVLEPSSMGHENGQSSAGYDVADLAAKQKCQHAAMGLFGFALLGRPRLAEAAGAALAFILVNDLTSMIWRSVAGKIAETAKSESTASFGRPYWKGTKCDRTKSVI